VLASGSDIGGSIRIPAAVNGVVGFKPPYGRVPQDPPFNLDTYCHCGPMARTVADCVLYENVIAGPDPRDIVSLRPKLELPARLDGIEGMRIALSPDLGDWPVDSEIRENTLAVAAALREEGAIVEEVDLRVPHADVMRAVAIHFNFGFGAWIAQEAAAYPELVTACAAAMPQPMALDAGGATLVDKHELEAGLYLPIGALLERYDALICSTVGTRGLVAGDDYVEHGIEVDGRELESYFGALLTLAFSARFDVPERQPAIPTAVVNQREARRRAIDALAAVGMMLPSGPRLLLADEPTTALDVTTQAEVMAILDELRRERGMYSALQCRAGPSIDAVAERLAAVAGRQVSAFEAPPGCPLAPRCPYAQRRCSDARPETRPLDGGMLRCVRAAELRETREAVAHV
jgi:hypothetical protein